ncbi:MAG: 4-hydroxy-3-methylbut-2-en-1-yl diphosphate synthase [Bacteroidetes bacterium]|nr:MAG: 4-hydroxy-3-methylbut-2-en-1-yl diphosphate synthase [Bacteroidota bacterium]
MEKPYCLSHFGYRRIPTREVRVGEVGIGGQNPIRIQSMTTTPTMDTLATVEQSIRMVEAGCEIVRITAPSKKDAANLAHIKAELRRRGYKVPLVADIHFTPNAAEVAARIVEKVRINPGNYADRKRFQNIAYTDASYQEELERIYERFSPLVKICKTEGTAMRIGTNHGSLSDRIMSRYGDTPLGMVESAMEFVRICEDHGFYDLVISMKASNPQVMVQAYRLLVQQMLARGQVYPLHLGVTEAGEGEDGGIKSALGIASLLLDGIGDTVRVSLTEEPEYEIPVARFLVNHFEQQAAGQPPVPGPKLPPLAMDPFSFHRRRSAARLNLGGGQVPRVVADLRERSARAADLAAIGYDYNPALDKYHFADVAADYVWLGDELPVYELPGALNAVYNQQFWQLLQQPERNYPLFESPQDFLQAEQHHSQLNFVGLDTETLDTVLKQKQHFDACCFVLRARQALPAYEWRYLAYHLQAAGMDQPLLLYMPHEQAFPYYEDTQLPAHLQISQEAKTQLSMAAQAATMLVDGLADGLWLEQAGACSLRAAFGMLQLSRLRITKTEYISCPSCGRTLFDLQETTARIRKRTEHLKGVKIGIMGCIVNGPGEMADADYGYVGVGPDKIALYRGQQVVERGVRTAEAVDKLIDLIKADGKWVETVHHEP